MFSVFLSSYRNTGESLGELEKAVETLACGSCSHVHSISRSPKLSLVFLYKLERNTAHVLTRPQSSLIVLLIINEGCAGGSRWWWEGEKERVGAYHLSE